MTIRFGTDGWRAVISDTFTFDNVRLVAQAIDAVEHTAAGNHVNLVVHGDHGHPEAYLFAALDAEFGDDVDREYVEQCGCGGHVVRVHV